MSRSAVSHVMRSRHHHPPRGSFDEFVKRMEPRLRQALVATYGPVDGREAAVDALSWAWEHWDQVRGMQNPAGYLYRVGQSAVRNFAARHLPESALKHRAIELPEIHPELQATLRQLSDQQRAVVVLIHAFRWRQSEVAEMLGVSPSTVHAHLNRALDRLRNLMEVPDAC